MARFNNPEFYRKFEDAVFKKEGVVVLSVTYLSDDDVFSFVCDIPEDHDFNIPFFWNLIKLEGGKLVFHADRRQSLKKYGLEENKPFVERALTVIEHLHGPQISIFQHDLQYDSDNRPILKVWADVREGQSFCNFPRVEIDFIHWGHFQFEVSEDDLERLENRDPYDFDDL